MEMTYENVSNYLAESECCDEALVYLNKCKDKGKTLKAAYMGIPNIAWFLWLIRHLERDLEGGLEIYELYNVISELGGFVEIFKDERDQAEKEVLEGKRLPDPIRADAFDIVHDNYQLSLGRLLSDYIDTIFDAFERIEAV